MSIGVGSGDGGGDNANGNDKLLGYTLVLLYLMQLTSYWLIHGSGVGDDTDGIGLVTSPDTERIY